MYNSFQTEYGKAGCVKRHNQSLSALWMGERKGMFYRKSSVFLLIVFMTCLLVTGCQGRDAGNDGVRDNNCRYGASTHEKKTVFFNVEDMSRMHPEGFAITDQAVFYVLGSDGYVKEDTDEDEESAQTSEEEKYTLVSYYSLIMADKELKNEKVIFESGDRLIDSVTGCKNEKAEDVLCVLLYDKERYYVQEYDANGEKISEVSVLRSDLKSDMVTRVCRIGDGRYLLYGDYAINLLASDGAYQTGIETDKKRMEAIVRVKDDIYGTYYNEKKQRHYLAGIDPDTLAFSEGIQIGGSGEVLAVTEQGNILMVSPGKLLSISPGEGKTEVLFDLGGFVGVETDTIRKLWEKDGEFWMIQWPREYALDNGPRMVSFTKAEDGEEAGMQDGKGEQEKDEYGRTIVKLYDPDGSAESWLGNYIEEYNRSNEKYKVEIICEPRDPSLLIASDNTPDLLYLSSVPAFETYYNQGYLEDLTPYIERSERLSPEEIQDFVFRLFGSEDGALYGITKACGLRIIAGKRSQIGSRQTWTVDEFLSWVESDPEICGLSQLDRLNLFDYCFIGNMDRYVDLDKGEAYFTQDAFKMLLERIKNLKFRQKTFPETGPEEGNDDRLLITMGVQSMSWIGETRFQVGDELAVMSYPNDDGRFVSVLSAWDNFAVLVNGKCKEGAYDFMEYYLLREEMLSSYKEEEHSQGIFYSVKRMFEHEISLVKGEYETQVYVLSGPGGTVVESYIQKYEITQDDIDLMQDMLDNGIVESGEAARIRYLVHGEIQGYLEGDKDLDTTCEIIQNRVQLMLDERK